MAWGIHGPQSTPANAAVIRPPRRAEGRRSQGHGYVVEVRKDIGGAATEVRHDRRQDECSRDQGGRPDRRLKKAINPPTTHDSPP